jgi:threonine dehydratase
VPRITLDDVLRARATIGGRVHRTPTLSSRTLSDRVGADCHLKAELLQRTGSFKPRGVLNKLASLTDEEKRRGVITISAGNHAQAVAWASAVEGIDALVVMWQTASAMKVAAARGYGATVDTEAADIAAAFERLEELTRETGRTLVHPYDDPLVIAGQGTVGLELLEDVPEVDVVVVPVGGGGLIAGIATAVAGRRPEARVVGVEPERSPAMHAALAAGRPVPVSPSSIADGLGAPFAGTVTLEVVRERVERIVLVTEAEIEEAMRLLYTRAKLACEAAGAAATAALMAGKVPLEPGESVVAVVSGGNVATQTAVATLSGR